VRRAGRSLGLVQPAVLRVLVLYIALRQQPGIVARLITGACKPEEPAPVISKATTAAQRVLVSTLGEIGTFR
jgi:siroheme synthase